MKSNSVIFFTENREANTNLIDLLESISTLSVCSYDSRTWDNVDLYSDKIVAFVFDGLKSEENSPWIVTKLSEDGVFLNVPVLFTSDESMYSFERMGYTACALDVVSEPFRYDLVLRRFENIVEINQLKQQMTKMTSIHTKRILDQATRLKEQTNKMHSMNFELVELLVAAIESRDMETSQHIKRIKSFTKALTEVVMKECPEYNITAVQAEYIFLASSVHDIGKIAIPDAIMLKPGRLTREEFEIMKTHTTHGAKLLDMIEEIGDTQYSKYCKDICLYHHERWDGKGYPKGLKGDEIPISAQIVSVADCYDALTSDRPYKKALSHEETVELIMNGACGVFSPQILECFRIALPEFSKIEKNFKAISEKEDIFSGISEANFSAVPEEYKPDYDSYSDELDEFKVSICEDRLLSAYNVIFEADLIENDFKIIRGSWSPLFPFLPKNIYEAFAQCHKICHPSDSARFLQNVSMSAFKQLVDSGRMKTRVEFRAIKRDVEYVILGILAFEVDEKKNITKVFGAFDAYFEDEIETEIQRSFTISDGLTGIPLQKKFAQDVDNYLRLMPNSKNALIYIDIDNMSLINSMFGYEYGNTFIKEIAEKLREIKETRDIYIGKGSGDKFFVFVKNISQARDLLVLIDTLHKTLKKTYHTPTEMGVFSVTLGVAKFPQNGKYFKDLYNNAEFASKVAKTNKNSTYAFFNPAMRDFSQISEDIQEISESFGNSETHTFFPVVNKKTGELVCYDYNPFAAGHLSQIAFTSDLYHAINKDAKVSKNFSILSVKNLLLSLIEKRDSGEKIPPMSIYTLLIPDDIPVFIQNLNDFISENDCRDIYLTINVPQDFLENIDNRRLNAFADYLKSLGFALGVYLVGERYIHNNCYINNVYKRIILAPNFIDNALMSKSAAHYAAETIDNLKSVSNYISVPITISDADAESLFTDSCEDFTHTVDPLNSFEDLFDDFKMRESTVEKNNCEAEPFISEINEKLFVHDFSNSGIVMISYDPIADKIEASDNLNNVVGFDVRSLFINSSRDFIEKFICPDDIEDFVLNISRAKETLKPVICTVKCLSNATFTAYKTYTVTIKCILNSVGLPSRYQCLLVPME